MPNVTDRVCSQESPTNSFKYKTTLLLFALLGYVVIFVALFILLGSVGVIIWLSLQSAAFLILLFKKKLIFIVFPLIWVLGRALWVKIEPPQGYSLTRKDFPDLFAEIDSLTKKLKAPKLHHVMLTDEFNAAIVQVPRLGVFGWHKNYLILGLELLLVLSPGQAKAVIAHELGHLSGNHSRFNGWIYRVRQSWYRIMLGFHQQNNVGANLMKRFFDWYYPRFNTYSFALARQNEYEADAISVELTNASIAANALINAHVSAPYVDSHYWKNYFKLADYSSEPGHLPWEGLSHFLSKNKEASHDLTQNLKQALEAQTTNEDTHPALQDRLQAIGATSPALPAPALVNAARAWFGEAYTATLAEFDQRWLIQNKEPWQARYDYVCEAKKTLNQLKHKENAKLKDDELWQKAVLTEELEESDAALALFRLYQQRHPQNPAAAFVLGRLAYERQDEAVLSQMKIALQQDNLIVDACQYAYVYLHQQNRVEEAEWWREVGNAQLDKQHEDEMDRSQLTVKDQLQKTTLDKEMIDYIVQQLASIPKVKGAWIAEKVTKHYPDDPAIAIAVKVSAGWFSDYDALSQEIYDALKLNNTVYVVPLGGDYKKLAKKISKAGDSIL